MNHRRHRLCAAPRTRSTLSPKRPSPKPPPPPRKTSARGLVPQRLYWWRKKLVTKDAAPTSRFALLPVKVVEPRRGEPVTVLLRSGHTLKLVDGAENPHRFDGRGRYVVRRFSGHGSGRQRSGARRRCRRAPPGAPRAPRPAIPRRLHLCRADCVSPDVVAQPRRRAAAFPGGGGSGFFCRYDSPSMSTTWQCWAKRSTVAWMDVAPSKTSPHFL